MANVVKLKRSAVSGRNPTADQLELGEVALNTADGNLFFKRDDGNLESIITVANTSLEQTLYNKSFNGDVGFDNGDITITNGNLILDTDSKAIDLSSGAGLIDDQGSDGLSNQILTSTGSGIRWITNTSGNLAGLNDVSFSSLSQNQILKYNGTVWVNADENAVVSSAVFAANALSDLGLVTDASITLSEDLEPEHETETQPNGMGDVDTYYNMGSIAIDGVVGLRNVDQSLKSDYISYSIIFGF
jgi:hypothetical protein